MPYRRMAALELGEFLGAIAQPRRIQILEELRSGPQDVGTLARKLAVPQANVSQHLAVLRSLRVVTEHREGRRVVYQLSLPRLADWLVEGMQFLPTMTAQSDQLKEAVMNARAAWKSATHEPKAGS
ncbi:MAG: metalloregulator ArsR/SmtB family transcription factor [Pirellulales bacterium]